MKRPDLHPAFSHTLEQKPFKFFSAELASQPNLMMRYYLNFVIPPVTIMGDNCQ